MQKLFSSMLKKQGVKLLVKLAIELLSDYLLVLESKETHVDNSVTSVTPQHSQNQNFNTQNHF